MDQNKLKPVSLAKEDGYTFFRRAWLYPPPSDCSLEERMVWLKVAALHGLFFKGVFDKEQGAEFKQEIIKEREKKMEEEETRKKVRKALEILKRVKDPTIKEVVEEITSSLPEIPFQWTKNNKEEVEE